MSGKDHGAHSLKNSLVLYFLNTIRPWYKIQKVQMVYKGKLSLPSTPCLPVT